MKKIIPIIFSLFLVGSVFGAAGDVIFKQINDNGTAVADRVIPLPFPFTDRLYGFNASNSRPVQLIIGAGLSVSGTYPNGLILTSTGSGGTVTSVALSAPSIFSVTGSPVTTSGTLTLSLATQSANVVFAGPSTGIAAAPTFRSLVVADLPTAIPNANLQNSAITIAGTSVSLGGSITLDTITGLSSTGIVVRSAANTLIVRTATGTANEITVTNGTGVSGNPTFSLPSSLTFTGKTVTGGTFNSGAFNGTVGASTPDTGAFTTISATGLISTTKTSDVFLASGATTQSRYIRLSNTGGNAFLGVEDSTGSTFGGTAYAGLVSADTEFDVIIGGTKRMMVTGSGITVNSTTLLSTSVSLTNGAGANVGTLTNSPVTGNPTKWIPINDNGTVRYLPAF